MNLNEMKDKLIFSFFENMPDLFEEFLAKLFEYSKYELESQNTTYPWKENGKDSNLHIKPDLVLYQDKLFDTSFLNLSSSLNFAEKKWLIFDNVGTTIKTLLILFFDTIFNIGLFFIRR